MEDVEVNDTRSVQMNLHALECEMDNLVRTISSLQVSTMLHRVKEIADKLYIVCNVLRDQLCQQLPEKYPPAKCNNYSTMQYSYDRRQAALNYNRRQYEASSGCTEESDDTGEDEIDRM